MEKHEFGLWAEEQACRFLEARGMRVLERRVRFREGEIDVICEGPDGRLLFVEVKGRRSAEFGDVVESLTTQKVRRTRRAIWRWREASGDRRPGRMAFLGLELMPNKHLKFHFHDF
ncbi:YraN family protein [Patescibacteria group bacterium]|nr:YraN family protein [Patescibacteria group bacterium]